jgi:hypothetical protein
LKESLKSGARMTDPTQVILLYLIMPVWLLAGVAD